MIPYTRSEEDMNSLKQQIHDEKEAADQVLYETFGIACPPSNDAYR